jgi:hypothetical protein
MTQTWRQCAKCRDGIYHVWFHGVGSSGYNQHGCRCDLCKAWNAERCAVSSERAKAKRATAMPKKAHGTQNGYHYWGCRCKPCTKANREARLDWDRKKANGYKLVTNK